MTKSSGDMVRSAMPLAMFLVQKMRFGERLVLPPEDLADPFDLLDLFDLFDLFELVDLIELFDLFDLIALFGLIELFDLIELSGRRFAL